MTYTYTGPALTSSVGEVLSTGDAVRVVAERDVFGVAIALVDTVGEYSGRTYTVWSIPAGDLAVVEPADVCPSCGAGTDELVELAPCSACGADNTDEAGDLVEAVR